MAYHEKVFAIPQLETSPITIRPQACKLFEEQPMVINGSTYTLFIGFSEQPYRHEPVVIFGYYNLHSFKKTMKAHNKAHDDGDGEAIIRTDNKLVKGIPHH